MPPILDDEYNDEYDFIEIQSNSNTIMLPPPLNKQTFQLNSQTTNTEATTTASYMSRTSTATATATMNKLRSPIYVSYHHKGQHKIESNKTILSTILYKKFVAVKISL